MFRAEFQAALEREQNHQLSVSTYQMDDLMEKLKLLNFDTFLMKELKMKPLNRYYFVKSTNPGEQFFVFTSLCAWLLRKTGRTFEQPQEFDDPSIVITKIINFLNEMDIPTDFPSNKLIHGAGPICVFILDCLATQAFKISKNEFEKFAPKQDEETLTEILENDSEIILEKVEEEQNAMLIDDSDDEKNSVLDLNTSRQKTPKSVFKFDTLADSENWRLELERVLPQLKVFVKSDPRDWRAHLEQMKNLRSNIESASDDTKNHLTKLENDIVYVMEKVESREKHLNNDLRKLIEQYKNSSIELNQINNLIKENESEKMEKEQELLNLLNEVDTIKSHMEQRGNAMTDGSPVILIKKTIAKLKEEISDMDLQIGVLDHTINTELLKQHIQNIESEPMRSVL